MRKQSIPFSTDNSHIFTLSSLELISHPNKWKIIYNIDIMIHIYVEYTYIKWWAYKSLILYVIRVSKVLHHWITPGESEEKVQMGKSVVAFSICKPKAFEWNDAHGGNFKHFVTQDFSFPGCTRNNKSIFHQPKSSKSFSKSLKSFLRLGQMQV